MKKRYIILLALACLLLAGCKTNYSKMSGFESFGKVKAADVTRIELNHVWNYTNEDGTQGPTGNADTIMSDADIIKSTIEDLGNYGIGKRTSKACGKDITDVTTYNFIMKDGSVEKLVLECSTVTLNGKRYEYKRPEELEEKKEETPETNPDFKVDLPELEEK